MNTKEHILNHAQILFLQKGYTKTTMRCISQAADVNLGLLPYYFKNKEQMAILVYECLMHNKVQELEALAYIYSDPIETLYCYFLALSIKIHETSGFYPFYCELLCADIGPIKSLAISNVLVDEIQKKYRLKVSDEDRSTYLAMMKGAERALTLYCKPEQNIDTFKKCSELLVLQLTLMLGLSKEHVLGAINHVNASYQSKIPGLVHST